MLMVLVLCGIGLATYLVLSQIRQDKLRNEQLKDPRELEKLRKAELESLRKEIAFNGFLIR